MTFILKAVQRSRRVPFVQFVRLPRCQGAPSDAPREAGGRSLPSSRERNPDLMIRRRLGPLLALALAAGCAPAPDEPADSFDGLPADASELEPADISPNGTSLNGMSLNGTSLNGTGLTGVTLNSVNLTSGVVHGGVTLTNMVLSTTNFSGKKSGVAMSGAVFVGAYFNASLSNGTSLRLRVDGRAQLAGDDADTYADGVSYETTSGWSPLCGSAVPACLAAKTTSAAGDAANGSTGTLLMNES